MTSFVTYLILLLSYVAAAAAYVESSSNTADSGVSHLMAGAVGPASDADVGMEAYAPKRGHKHAMRSRVKLMMMEVDQSRTKAHAVAQFVNDVFWQLLR